MVFPDPEVVHTDVLGEHTFVDEIPDGLGVRKPLPGTVGVDIAKGIEPEGDGRIECLVVHRVFSHCPRAFVPGWSRVAGLHLRAWACGPARGPRRCRASRCPLPARFPAGWGGSRPP